MKFVSVRDFRNKSASIWKQLNDDNDIVITSNGKPLALLASVSDDNLEETLKTIRKAKHIAAINSMQLTSLQKGNNSMGLSEINAEISEARKAKPR